ncbi:MAG: hypothetical protein HYR63_14770 [Proteobacteria bacterium]|nr:hypothetical protein [Pseudomonadota bacterium]MBI3498756.1 hypothetical protein [Pseudomonadota bacterium]
MQRMTFLCRPLSILLAALWLTAMAAPMALPVQAEEKKDERKRGEVKKPDPLIVVIPGEAPGARCQGEVMVNAFKRLGALTSLQYMSTSLANATGAGINAITSYCTDHGDECETAAGQLQPRIGLVPPSCGG